VNHKRHKIIFSPSAERDIERLEIDVSLQLVKNIKSYPEPNPLPFGKSRIKKLTGCNPPLYRLRSGDYRAYYRILPGAVIILAMTHRKNSEKILKTLKDHKDRSLLKDS
jgi:mRNA-degrading endonuclease RelE of RelBE toxin-antitoxin system